MAGPKRKTFSVDDGPLLPVATPIRRSRSLTGGLSEIARRVRWAVWRAALLLWRGRSRRLGSGVGFWGKCWRALLLFSLVLFVATPILAPSYVRLPGHYRALREGCWRGDQREGCANGRNEKVFVAVSLYDPTGAIASGPWAHALESLVRILGPRNVFLSIYENDSGPAGNRSLKALETRLQTLGAKTNFVIEGKAHYDPFQHITLPDGTRLLKRLAYQSYIRNRALEPLDRLSAEDRRRGLVEFDKVLFLNDAVFRPLDAANLLFSTNFDAETGRARYLAACAMDFANPWVFYDVYAQRDGEGYSNGVPVFPYFGGEGGRGTRSRDEVIAQRDGVRVKSCWGGMVAAQAKWIQNLGEDLVDERWREPGYHVLDPDHPKAVAAPVRFRYEPEVFVDACECCLFQADLQSVARRAAALGEAEDDGDDTVFVNPYVRVAYSFSVLGWIPWAQRWERLLALPQRIITYFAGLPTPNPHREVQEGQPFTEEIWEWNEGPFYSPRSSSIEDNNITNAVVTAIATTNSPNSTILHQERERAATDSSREEQTPQLPLPPTPLKKRTNRYTDPKWPPLGRWATVQRRGRSGMFCLVREMQVIMEERREDGEVEVNWADWQVPWQGQRFYFPT